MTTKPAIKISYPRTLGAIKKVVCDSFGLHIVLTPLANPLSIINDIKLRIFYNKKQLVEGQIETLLGKANQPISTVIETVANTAAETRVILVPLEFDVPPKGSKVILSYEDINGKRTLELTL